METSPKYIELVRPANLNLRELFKSVPAEVLFANTKIAPDKYSSEKNKWLGRIRMKKFYRLFTMIHNSPFCDPEGFIVFNAREFEKLVGSSFARTCRLILENLKVVECRFDPHLGLTLLWVRFTPQYQNQPQVSSTWKASKGDVS